MLEDAAREAESRIAAAQDEADATLSRTENEAAALLSHTQVEVEQMLAQGQSDAARTVDRARAEAERLVAADTIRLEAERQAKALTQHAESDASRVRAEADIYVDKRLANLETPCGRHWTRSVAVGGARTLRRRAQLREAVYDFTGPGRCRRTGRWAATHRTLWLIPLCGGAVPRRRCFMPTVRHKR